MWLSEHLKTLLTIDPAAPAVESDGRWWSWGDISRWLDWLAATAREEAVDLPADVAVVMENRFIGYASVIAVLASESTLIPLSPMKGDEALAEEIRSLRPRVVLADGRFWESGSFTSAVQDTGALGLTLPVGNPGDAHVVVHAARRSDADGQRETEIAVKMSTSGTTGPPKRVALAYGVLERSLRHVRRHYACNDDGPELRSGTVILMNSPVHMAGFDAALRTVSEGRKACLLERFTVPNFEAAVRRHRPRLVSLVPAAMRMVYDEGVAPDAFEATKAVLVGSAPLSTSLWRDFEHRYGVAVLVNYGATEVAGGIAGWTIADHERWIADKRGSVGRAHPGVELRVVGDDGSPLPAGERGTLHVRSQSLGPQWLVTSDLATVDADGFLWLHGRSDGVITRGGFKVWPAEVESVLEEHPAVLEACVVKRSDERLGEVPVAAVELTPGAVAPQGTELIAWARARLTGYQTPVEVVIFEPLPRTNSMKVARGQVRDLLAEVRS